MNSACAALSPRPYLSEILVAFRSTKRCAGSTVVRICCLESGRKIRMHILNVNLLMKSILFNKRHWESVVYSTFLNLKPQLGKICQNIAAFRSTLVVRFSSALCFGMHPTPSPFVLRGHAPPPLARRELLAASACLVVGQVPRGIRCSFQFPVFLPKT